HDFIRPENQPGFHARKIVSDTRRISKDTRSEKAQLRRDLSADVDSNHVRFETISNGNNEFVRRYSPIRRGGECCSAVHSPSAYRPSGRAKTYSAFPVAG